MEDIIHLRLLGAVQVERAGEPVRGFRSRKALALLGYLALQGQPAPRERQRRPAACLTAQLVPSGVRRQQRRFVGWVPRHRRCLQTRHRPGKDVITTIRTDTRAA